MPRTKDDKDAREGEEEEHEEEEEEEEEDLEEEEVEEWTEPVDLEEYQDGPSTFYVGGFSTIRNLQDALDIVKYREDVVLVYPGVYTEKEVRMDESCLEGLSIMSVPVFLGPLAGYAKKIRIPRDAHRMGPWYAPFGSDSPKANAVTVTAEDSTKYPVFEGKLVIVKSEPFNLVNDDGKGNISVTTEERPRRVRRYIPQREEDENEEDEEKEPEEDDVGEDGESVAKKKPAPSPLTVQGLCFLAGAAFEPLTRATVRHCVFGRRVAIASPTVEGGEPSDSNDAEQNTSSVSTQPTTTVSVHPLTEVLVEFCVIYGSRQHAVYAYPRSTFQLCSSMVFGPLEKDEMHTLQISRAMRHTQANPVMRLAKREDLVVTSNPIPKSTLCRVGIYLDDADVKIMDVYLTNTDVGVLLVDGCSEAEITSTRVENHTTNGILFVGPNGSARVQYCAARHCGRECLLVRGPVPLALPPPSLIPPTVFPDPRHGDEDGAGEEEEEEPDEEEEGEEAAAGRRPRKWTRMQHPTLRGNGFEGTVRLEGHVTCAAVSDNVIYVPKEGPVAGIAPLSGPSEERSFALKGFYIHTRGSTPPREDD